MFTAVPTPILKLSDSPLRPYIARLQARIRMRQDEQPRGNRSQTPPGSHRCVRCDAAHRHRLPTSRGSGAWFDRYPRITILPGKTGRRRTTQGQLGKQPMGAPARHNTIRGLACCPSRVTEYIARTTVASRVKAAALSLPSPTHFLRHFLSLSFPPKQQPSHTKNPCLLAWPTTATPA